MTIISVYIPNIVDNPYSYNIRRILKEYGIETISLRNILRSASAYRECKIINLNWYENVDSYKQYLIKRILLTLLSKSHIKIIYTFHNKKPHSGKYQKQSNKLMRILCKNSDAIIGLCTYTRVIVEEICGGCSKKVSIIPHPNYIKNYNVGENKKDYGIPDDAIVFLFFGTISAYKNIEMLIDVFNNEISDENAYLLIVGGTTDNHYVSDILKRVNNNTRIITDFRYIPDEEISAVYGAADIVILPYNKESSLNSGALYLSFSLEKTVICPDIGSVIDINDKSFIYHYDYKNQEDHYSKLVDVINHVNEDRKEKKSILKEKGARAYKYVSEIHSDEIIGASYEKLYHRLIERVE